MLRRWGMKKNISVNAWFSATHTHTHTHAIICIGSYQFELCFDFSNCLNIILEYLCHEYLQNLLRFQNITRNQHFNIKLFHDCDDFQCIWYGIIGYSSSTVSYRARLFFEKSRINNPKHCVYWTKLNRNRVEFIRWFFFTHTHIQQIT